MSSLVLLALMIVSGNCSPLSSRERDIVVSSLPPSSSSSSLPSSNSVDFDHETPKKLRAKSIDGVVNDSEANETSEDIEEDVPASFNDSRTKFGQKKARKHKAFFLNHPMMSQFHYNHAIGNWDSRNHEQTEARRKTSHRKRYQQESQIYYVKLPPTPYMYVPGLGYVSQPPTYSTSGLQRPINAHHNGQKPSRPQIGHHKPGTRPGTKPMVKPGTKPGTKPSVKPSAKPFIKLPVDFVSNGKPTGVYQWQSNKRTDSSLNSLDNGPYRFNGRPTSLYLLNADGRKTGHQPIRLADYSNEAYY